MTEKESGVDQEGSTARTEAPAATAIPPKGVSYWVVALFDCVVCNNHYAVVYPDYAQPSTCGKCGYLNLLERKAGAPQ